MVFWRSTAAKVARNIGVWIGLGVMIVSPVVGAVENGGVGGRPANPDPSNPRSQSIFIYTLDRGKNKTDQVKVSNNTTQTQTILLYAVDGVVTNTGAYTCKQQSEATQDLGGWIQLSKKEVTLDAGKDTDVDFSVKVPQSADVGEHNACIVFENKNDGGEARGNIRIKTRQAIRVVTTVPGALQRNVDITSFTTVNKPEKQVLSVALKNTGNVSADVDTHVELHDLFGGTFYTNGGSYPVLSNQKLELSFDNERQPFWGGWYKARATIEYNKKAGTFGIAESQETIRKASKDILVFITPSTGALIIIGLIVLILLAIILTWIITRTRRRKQRKTWHEYHIQDGDTLESIATKHHVSWKALAKVNGVKAPYGVDHIKVLRVPGSTKKSHPKKD